MPLDTPGRPVTKREFVTETLRAMILSGELEPGEQLVLRPLAERLGVSVMPIRDALRVLEAQGLVVGVDHRGASVVDLGPDEIQEGASLRMWLEVYAIHQAASRHDAQSLRLVEEALEACELASTADDADRFSLENRRFHEAAESQAHAIVRSEIDDLWNRFWQRRRHAKLFQISPERMHHLQEEHRQIFAALQARDPEAAASAMERHRLNTLAAWREAYALRAHTVKLSPDD
jgi:DNA-binding GntR family transcriptional regulator